jgi:hypothetical protein
VDTRKCVVFDVCNGKLRKIDIVDTRKFVV